MAPRALTDAPVLLEEHGNASTTVARSPRWFATAAIVAALVGGAVLAGRLGPDDGRASAPAVTSTTVTTVTSTTATTVTSTTVTSTTVPSTDELAEKSSEPVTPLDLGSDHVLVGMADEHYVFVDFLAGEATLVPLSVRPTGIAVAEDRMIYLHDETGHVEFFRLGDTSGGTLATGVDYFSPSAEPGRIWLGVPQVAGFLLETDLYGIYYQSVDRTGTPGIDPRYRHEPGGGVYQMVGAAEELSDQAFSEPVFLGRHVPVATSRHGVVAQICDAALACQLEQWLDDGPWNFVADVRGGESTNVVVNADGTWVGLVDGGVTLVDVRPTTNPAQIWWRSPRTTADAVAFAPNDDLAFVVDTGSVTIVDLTSGAEQSSKVAPRFLADIEQWIVVTNWNEISAEPG